MRVAREWRESDQKLTYTLTYALRITLALALTLILILTPPPRPHPHPPLGAIQELACMSLANLLCTLNNDVKLPYNEDPRHGRLGRVIG